MPTPIDILLDPVSLAAIGIYAALAAWEALAPARPLPKIRGWALKSGLVAFLAYFYVSSYLPLLWDAYLARYQLLDLTGLGALGGATAGLLVYELGVYWWHRSMHRVDPLWRVFHQVHHSAERLDTYGAFWFSPWDMVGWTALGSLTLVLVIGLTPEAATAVLLAVFFLGIFQHANVRTPQWLGYIVQRPESHSVHHERGVHYYNFSDLPLFDLLFGTFRNPAAFAEHQGFYDGASSRLLEMLALRDVSAPPAAPARPAFAAAETSRVTKLP
jgi:sterol desaturase/sphingolipid hydroxylase (fatty acid hydroxylase superfamily)